MDREMKIIYIALGIRWLFLLVLFLVVMALWASAGS